VINVRLIQCFSVSIHYTIGNPDAISRHPNESLDQRLIDIWWISEYDNVAMLWLLVWQEIFADRPSRSISQLVNQKVIAHPQRVLH